MRASASEKIFTKIGSMSGAPQQTGEHSEDEVNTIKEVLSFTLRISGVYRFDWQRFVRELVSMNFSDEFRTDFVARRLELNEAKRIARYCLEARLRIGDYLSINDESNCIKQKVRRDAANRHAFWIKDAASNHNIERTLNQAPHQRRDFFGIML